MVEVLIMGTKRGTPEWKANIIRSRKGQPRSANYRFWTQDEVDYLRASYSNIGIGELSKHLNRNYMSIWMKSRKLGLTMLHPMLHWHRKDTWEYVYSNPYQDRLSDTDIAYIAGLFDGEGFLTIEPKRQNCWRMGIANTNVNVMDWLEAKIMHSYRTKHNRPKGYKTSYDWLLTNNFRIRALLILLLPYLIIKKARTLEAISSIESIDTRIFEGLVQWKLTKKKS